MYTDACSLFSQYTDTATKNIFYVKTVLNNVQWQNSKGRNVYKSGATSIDTLTAYIKPEATEKIYIDIIQFLQLSSEEKRHYWTMQAGDILVKDAIDYEYAKETILTWKYKVRAYNLYEVYGDFDTKDGIAADVSGYGTYKKTAITPQGAAFCADFGDNHKRICRLCNIPHHILLHERERHIRSPIRHRRILRN